MPMSDKELEGWLYEKSTEERDLVYHLHSRGVTVEQIRRVKWKYNAKAYFGLFCMIAAVLSCAVFIIHCVYIVNS